MKKSHLKKLIKQILLEELENIVQMCAYCQKEFGLDSKKLPANISHGICKRHAMEMYIKIGMNSEKAKLKVANSQTPDLQDRPDLVQLYK